MSETGCPTTRASQWKANLFGLRESNPPRHNVFHVLCRIYQNLPPLHACSPLSPHCGLPSHGWDWQGIPLNAARWRPSEREPCSGGRMRPNGFWHGTAPRGTKIIHNYVSSAPYHVRIIHFRSISRRSIGRLSWTYYTSRKLQRFCTLEPSCSCVVTQHQLVQSTKMQQSNFSAIQNATGLLFLVCLRCCYIPASLKRKEAVSRCLPEALSSVSFP